MLTTLARYPELIQRAGLNRAPHALVHYLQELQAASTRAWYNAEQFVVEDAALRNARRARAGHAAGGAQSPAALLGVSAPETM